ncbi:MAG: hypothetical protein QNJ32_12405 [Xenococcaceae cyanobacterium MO_167.B27]|nr:hypothetical protein [Xenococcaceae cyanobacterium MO_167.B27]
MINVNRPKDYLAEDDKDAKARFDKYRQKDPFPKIAPALLNSADICDYVAKTGMIHPFEIKKLKSASYAVPIRGKLVYWDEQGEKQIVNIERQKSQTQSITNSIVKKKEFTLKKNSIAFVTLEPMFRVPDYIAIRFNLKITHVYKGLLLGTGPLVDPGFTGQLSIPLHNLTNNDYTFSVDEDLIWMEFTKLSPIKHWKDMSSPLNYPQYGNYVEFRNNPENDVEDYLSKAIKSSLPYSIRSSIPDAVSNANNSAEKAVKISERTQNILTIGGGVTLVLLFIALINLFFQVNNLVQNTYRNINRSYQELRILEANIDKQRLNFLAEDQEKIKTIENQLQTIEESINKLKKLDLKN